MRYLSDCKEDIHSCSKCGLCQSVCPIYKITGNDCTVSRGHFIMLNGLIKGDLKMSKTILLLLYSIFYLFIMFFNNIVSNCMH